MVSILRIALCAKIETRGARVRHTHTAPKMSSPKEQEVEETYDENSCGPWEDEYDSGMLCELCHLEEPMFPRKNSREDCHILCADCYWDEEYRRKQERKLYYSLHLEEYEAYRKQAAETLGVPYTPLPEEWYQQRVNPLHEESKQQSENEEQNKIESKSTE